MRMSVRWLSRPPGGAQGAVSAAYPTESRLYPAIPYQHALPPGQRTGHGSVVILPDASDPPERLAGRTFDRMKGMPRRIEPTTDRTTAALILGCSTDGVGYCPRCWGFTCRTAEGADHLPGLSSGRGPVVDADLSGAVIRWPAPRLRRTWQRLRAPCPHERAGTVRDAATPLDPARCLCRSWPPSSRATRLSATPRH